MTQYSSGTYTLMGLVGDVIVATVDTNSLVTFTVAGFVDQFFISSAADSTLIVNNVSVDPTLYLSTDGGAIQFGALYDAI